MSAVKPDPASETGGFVSIFIQRPILAAP